MVVGGVPPILIGEIHSLAAFNSICELLSIQKVLECGPPSCQFWTPSPPLPLKYWSHHCLNGRLQIFPASTIKGSREILSNYGGRSVKMCIRDRPLAQFVGCFHIFTKYYWIIVTYTANSSAATFTSVANNKFTVLYKFLSLIFEKGYLLKEKYKLLYTCLLYTSRCV